MAGTYDVGILGVWYGCNYGSIATYYSLHEAVRSMGKSVLMIHRPYLEDFDQEAMEKRHSMKFARKNYQISKAYHVSETKELNNICDTFLLGSDQLWNYGITKTFGHSYFLDFAADEKNKVAYATSFGTERFMAPWHYAFKALRCMRRMNYVSVREEIHVRMCNKMFGIRAEHTLDPVLLCESSCLGAVAKQSHRDLKKNYLAAYILDPNPEKREALLYLAQKMGKDLVIMLDGWPHLFKNNKAKMDLNEYIMEGISVADWLFYIKNSDFVVTDSFHGTCMALLFERPFYAFGNPKRGASRFESLMEMFGLFSHYMQNPLQVKQLDNAMDIDYQKVNQKLLVLRQTSMEWLKNAICNPQVKHSVVIKKEQLYWLRMMKSILKFRLASLKVKIISKK